jgi:RNA polymerase sigma-54 factor
MTKQNLDIRASQSLALTPRLQQAIQLLQLSALELNTFVASQVDENPLLTHENSDMLIQSLTLCDNQAHPTPEDDDGAMDAYTQHLHTDGLMGHGHDDNTPPPYEGKTEESTMAYLLEQLHITFTDPQSRLIGEFIIYNTQEHGFLEITPDEIASILNVTPATVETVLATMQTFDPPGIFARSIKECFRIQLHQAGTLTPAMVTFLDNLERLGTQPLAKVAKTIQLSVETCQNLLDQLRVLNRRPLEGGGNMAMQPVEPDVLMYKNTNGQWDVELNSQALPRVYINSEYYHNLQHGIMPHHAKQYVKERLSHAQWLIHAINQRCETLVNVAREIIRHQEGFFEKGYSAFRPLTLRHIAQATGLHESTVSRITNAKCIATPYGTLSLKFFFSAAISPIYEDSSLSARRIQESMRTLFKTEPAAHPYADDDIVSLLNNQGMAVARRTIAKYRHVLQVPSSVERKRAYELNPALRFV